MDASRKALVVAFAVVMISSPAFAQDLGDDAGQFANDGECDDPRFEGSGVADYLEDENSGHDATDCKKLLVQGIIRWRTNMLAECEADGQGVRDQGLTCLLVERHLASKGDIRRTPYVNGRRHGVQTYVELNGDRSATPYVNGVIHGTAIDHFTNDEGITGKIESTYADGEVKQRVTTWDTSGTKSLYDYNRQRTRNYNDDGSSAEFTETFNGSRTMSTYNADGELHGTQNWTHHRGRDRKETPYVNGVIQGTVVETDCTWQNEKQVQSCTNSETRYVNGKKHGLRTEVEYHYSHRGKHTGTTHREMRYANDKLHGTYKSSEKLHVAGFTHRSTYCYVHGEQIRKSACRDRDLR